jgi:nicotinic acid mononucleotide adenylyltransferase
MIKNFNLYERKITRKLKPIGDFIYDKFLDKPGLTYSTIKELYRPKTEDVIITISFYKKFEKNGAIIFKPADFSAFTDFYNFVEKYGFFDHFDIKISGIEAMFIIGYDKLEELKQTKEYQEYLEDITLKNAAKQYNL